MANDNDKCAHTLCNCIADDDLDYCSPQCEAAAGSDITALACECGHGTCQGTAAGATTA